MMPISPVALYSPKAVQIEITIPITISDFNLCRFVVLFFYGSKTQSVFIS